MLLPLLLQALRQMPWQRLHPRPETTRQRLPQQPQPVPGPVRLLALAIDFLSPDITDCHTP